MPDAKILGTAYAWRDGEQWYYTRSRDDAPENVIEVEGRSANGELKLHHFTGTGASIHGADSLMATATTIVAPLELETSYANGYALFALIIVGSCHERSHADLIST